MLIKRHQIKGPMVLNLILVLVSITAPVVNSVESRKKLDETTVPTTNGDEKCVPCGYNSPPPPSPPPPANPPPSPPPPSPKKPPSSKYCPPPPPPPSSYIYITGPPGNLYPVDENFNGASRHRWSLAAALPLLAGLLSLLAFW